MASTGGATRIGHIIILKEKKTHRTSDPSPTTTVSYYVPFHGLGRPEGQARSQAGQVGFDSEDVLRLREEGLQLAEGQGGVPGPIQPQSTDSPGKWSGMVG